LSLGRDQALFSLLDCAHYGVPILLHCRTRQAPFPGTYSQRERRLSDFVVNWVGAVLSFPSVVRRGTRADIAVAALKLLGLPTVLIDHGPT
jgi:hypothetical protein